MRPATRNLNQEQPNTGSETQSAQNRAAQTLETITQALKQQAQGANNNNAEQQNSSTG